MTIRGWRDRALLAAPLAVFGLLAVLTPSDDGPTVCPFALCTGMACPGCGMTRAASHLVRGNLDLAVLYHPLVPLILIEAAVAWLWFTLRRLGIVRPMSNRLLNIVLVGTVLSLLAVWALRLASGTLPPV